MKKFAVMTTKFELAPRNLTSTVANAVAIYGADVEECIALVDTIEEARAILAGFKPYTCECKWVTRFYDVAAAYIAEGEYEYDEDYASWEFISGGDIWDVNCMELPTETEEEEDED